MGEGKTLFRRVLEGLFLLAISRGVFYALGERGIHPDLWVARLIDGAATVASSSTQAIVWVLSGSLGLAGVFLLEKFFWTRPNKKHEFQDTFFGHIPLPMRRHLFRHGTGSKITSDARLTPPAPSAAAPDFIPLDKAAEIIWSAIQGTAFAEHMEDLERAPSKIRNTLSFQLVARGVVWGKKWPSHDMTLVQNGRLLNVMEDGTSLAYTSQTEAVITDAAVKPEDMDDFVRYAKSVSVRI